MTLRPSPWPIRPRFPNTRRSTGCSPGHGHPPDCGPNRPYRPTDTSDVGNPAASAPGVTNPVPVPDDSSANRRRSFPIDGAQPHAASSLGGFPTRAEVAPAPTLAPRPASENLHQTCPSQRVRMLRRGFPKAATGALLSIQGAELSAVRAELRFLGLINGRSWPHRVGSSDPGSRRTVWDLEAFSIREGWGSCRSPPALGSQPFSSERSFTRGIRGSTRLRLVLNDRLQ